MARFIVSFFVMFLLLSCVSAAFAAGQVNVFIYHRFGESRYPSTNISTEVFMAQLEYLKENNYQVLSLGEIVSRLRSGKALPDKSAAICVDDAFTSFADAGMPIIRKFGFPVSLFINTDSVGSHGYLSWEQIKALHDEGVEMGNHTATHAYLVELEENEDFASWKKRIVEDISKAQAAFQKHLQVSPGIFVYPYGEYSDEVVDIVKELGFSAAFAQQSGVVHSQHDPFTLPRFPMGGPYATIDGFISKLKMKPLVVEQELPYSAVIKDNPPELLLKIDTRDVDMRRVNCFAQAGSNCSVEPLADKDGWFRVTADSELKNRRNKYTLTVPGKKGGWHWYSHLWLNAKKPAIAPAKKELVN